MVCLTTVTRRSARRFQAAGSVETLRSTRISAKASAAGPPSLSRIRRPGSSRCRSTTQRTAALSSTINTATSAPGARRAIGEKDQGDLAGLRKVPVRKVPEYLAVLSGGVMVGHLDMPSSLKRGEKHERVGRPFAHRLIIDACGLVTFRRHGPPDFPDQLFRRVVEAHQRLPESHRTPSISMA